MNRKKNEEIVLASRLTKALAFFHGRGWGRFALGLMVATAILGAKVLLVEHQPWYERIRLGTYSLIQRALSNSDGNAPVVVVDISKIELEPEDWEESGDLAEASSKGSQKSGRRAVSRTALQKILTKIASAGPRSIGVDVDFSPDPYGNPISPSDSGFFKACTAISERAPLFLGVYRHGSGSEDQWLGRGNEDLAAGLGIGKPEDQHLEEMEVPAREVLRMYCWTQVMNPSKKGAEDAAPTLPTLASALAGGPTKPQLVDHPRLNLLTTLNDRLSWAVEYQKEYEPEAAFRAKGFLVDFGRLDAISKKVIHVDQIDEAPPETFRGKVVILGDVRAVQSEKNALSVRDMFRVPGRGDNLYSGVLLHACAVDTLLESPLLEGSALGRIVMDFLLAIVAISLIELLGWLFYGRRGKEHHDFRIHWSVTSVIVLAVGAVAIPLVGMFRLVWDDAVFLSLGLLAHTGLDHLLSSYVHRHHHSPHQEPPNAAEVHPQVPPPSEAPSNEPASPNP